MNNNSNTKEFKINKSIEKTIDSLIEQVLNNPNFSWIKTWENIASGFKPYNPTTGKAYSGFNSYLLSLYASIKGSMQFATMNQINKAGGKVIKGSKAIPLFHFQWLYIDKNKKVINESEFKSLSKQERDEYNKFPKIYSFSVFSLTDCENISFKEPKPEKTKKHNPIKFGEKIINAYSSICRIDIGKDNSKAFYSTLDFINLPSLNAFKTPNDFYHTAFHEIAHSTGHKERLNRDLSGYFGNEKYAKEELIAELTGAMLDVKTKIATDKLLNNSVAYLNGWCKNLTDKKHELYLGLNHASKAYNFIVEKTGI